MSAAGQRKGAGEENVLSMFESIGPPPLDANVRKLNTIWIILLVPWLPFAALAGMAFDGGPKWSAYVFVWSIWTYPLTVGIGYIFRRIKPMLSYLPLVNAAGFLISGFQR